MNSLGFMEKLIGAGKSQKYSPPEYEELDLSEYETEIEGEAETFVKVAEVTGLNEVAEIRRQIYEGNIVIADVAFLKHDQLTLDRIIKDLKQLADDVNGDVVWLGEEYLIITPTGIKIDRNKIKGVKSK